MSGHTPGRLQLWTSNSWRRFHAEHGEPVCEPVTQRDGHPDLHFRNGGPEGPDARRIVAAWNACIGYSTDAIERANFPEVVSDAIRLANERDELIEHLTALVSDVENRLSDPHTLRHARELLAKYPACGGLAKMPAYIRER